MLRSRTSASTRLAGTLPVSSLTTSSLVNGLGGGWVCADRRTMLVHTRQVTAHATMLVMMWRRFGVDDSLLVFTQVFSLLLLRFGDHYEQFGISACIPYPPLRIVVEGKAHSSLLHQNSNALWRDATFEKLCYVADREWWGSDSLKMDFHFTVISGRERERLGEVFVTGQSNPKLVGSGKERLR